MSEGAETAAKASGRAVRGEAIRDDRERFLPRRFAEAVTILDQRRLDPIRALDDIVAPPALDAGIGAIDAVLARGALRPLHFAFTGLHIERATDRAETADGAHRLHIPRMLAVLAVGERADGADLDAHAAVRAVGVVERVTEGGDDRALETPVRHRDRRCADHFLAGADALRALDAAVVLVVDQVREMLDLAHHLRAMEGVLRHAVLIGRVLQLAFAGGVAGRAIQRVIDEKEFQQVLTRLVRYLVVRGDFHAVAHGRRAGDLRAATATEDIDDAHLARAPGAQVRLVAEGRDRDAHLLGGIDDRRARRDSHALAVDCTGDVFRHVSFAQFEVRGPRSEARINVPDPRILRTST